VETAGVTARTASCELGEILMDMHRLAITRVVLLLALASPALAGPVRVDAGGGLLAGGLIPVIEQKSLKRRLEST